MINRSLFGAALAMMLCFGAVAPAYAQDEEDEGDEPEIQTEMPQQPPAEAKQEEKPGEKKEQAKKDPKTSAYEKAIKDLEKTEGVFTFYKRKKDVLLELPEDKLGKLFLVQATMNTGISSIGLQAGEPIGGNEIDAYRFEKHDESVWLVRPNLKYRWDKGDMFEVSAQRSMPEAILASFKIEQTDPEKKLYLVNVTQMFFGELFRLGEAVSFMLGGQYGLDREKSGLDSIKSFPENSVLHARLHYYSPRGGGGNPLLEALGFGGNQLEDSRSVPMRVTFNMWYRNDTGYKARLADPRVGYFTTDYYSFNKFLDDDRTERLIMRFNLQKKDPAAAMSEPVKPLVWIVDSSVPAQYRPSVKEGILRWNKAFEAIGFKDAVQVQDAPTDGSFDHADGRYNVVRWTMSPDTAYAIALTRVDPFTGEVLNASVNVDANILAFATSEYKDSTAPIEGAHGRSLQALLRDSGRKVTEDAFLWSSDREKALHALEEGLGKFGWRGAMCQLPHGLAEQAAFGFSSAVAANPELNKEQYARAFIADVVSHEVGHTLGLRHNFIASTYLTTDQLADDDLTSKESVTASVMDYTPVNVQAVLRGKGNFFSPTIGTYDKWAIQYGYAPLGDKTTAGEKAELAKIAARSGSPGLLFMTDENADAWDPFVVRFDNAKDPLAYSEKVLQAARRLRNYAILELPKPGESYDKRTRLILSSISRTFREGRFSARFVGGLSATRSFKGDAVELPTLSPIDPKLQRDAMSLVVRSCFDPESFNLPEKVLSSMSLDPASEENAGWNAPLREFIASQQMMLYATLMSAGTTDRIAENSYKSKASYGMDEHFGLMLGAVFKEIGSEKSIAPVRRDLQKFALTALMSQSGAPAGAINEDARTVATDALKRLEKRFATAQNEPGLDGMTKVHLRDSADTIQRFLNRQTLAR